jgi:cardiolipin synthase
MMHLAWESPLFYVTAFLYTVALFNCYRIVGNRLTPGASLAWILVNLSLPFIGVPLYFLVGQNRLRGYVRRFRQLNRQYVGKNGRLIDGPFSGTPSVDPALLPTYQSFKEVFGTFGPLYEPRNGYAELLVDGKHTFDAIFSAIAKARHYILIQYYILRSDRLGLELKEQLIKRAEEGIPVYLLYDDMGSFWLSRDYIRDLRRAGVKVERFLPLTNFRRFFQMNFRNHRKLVVVDGIWAFTGGLNVGDEYAHKRYHSKKKLEKKVFKYWRDTHIRISGPSVKAMVEVFLEDWYFATQQKIKLKIAALDHSYESALNKLPPPEEKTLIQVIPTGPTDETLISMMLFMHLIQSAKRRLWLATPYLIPDPSLILALELAVLRGVDVKIIIPNESDHKFVHWVTLSFAEQLETKGIELLVYDKGFMHQKVALVDHCLSVVGTMNLDNRAIYLNFETVVLVHSFDFNQQLEAMMLNDFTQCHFLKQEQAPWLRHLIKLRANIARLFGPLL